MEKSMKATIVKANDLFARMNAIFMEIIRFELERVSVYNLTAAQYMILHHLKDGKIPIGDIPSRSHYFGTNISYNVKKMVEAEYLHQEKAKHDQRTHYVFISEKSKKLLVKMDIALEEHAELLVKYGISKEDIKNALNLISKIDDFWTYTLAHRYRDNT